MAGKNKHNGGDNNNMELPYIKPYKSTTKHLTDVINQINFETWKQAIKKFEDIDAETR